MAYWFVKFWHPEEKAWRTYGATDNGDVRQAASMMMWALAKHRAARAVRCDGKNVRLGPIVRFFQAYAAYMSGWLLPTEKGDGPFRPADVAKQKAITNERADAASRSEDDVFPIG